MAGQNTLHNPDQQPAENSGLRLRFEGSPDLLAATLDAAAKRGKLAGFERGRRNGTVFTVRDFGGPFEAVLEARIEPRHPGVLHFDWRLQTRLAWVFLVVLVATVWPGVWLTDSMLRSYFTGYDYRTWMWYLPLTIPAVPWAMIVALRRSRQRARTESEKIIRTIASLTGATAEPAQAR